MHYRQEKSRTAKQKDHTLQRHHARRQLLHRLQREKAKVVKLDVVHNQLDIIWNGLDVESQSEIDPSDVNTTLNQFLKDRYMGAGSGCSGTLVLRAPLYCLTLRSLNEAECGE